MGDSSGAVTQAEVEPVAEQPPEFDFSGVDDLIDGEQPEKTTSPEGEDKPIDGELETSEDQAKLNARSAVGMLEMAFRLKDREHHYSEAVYAEGEQRLAPIFVRLNLNLPAIDVLAGVMWLANRVITSLSEIRAKKAKGVQDAKSTDQQAQ